MVDQIDFLIDCVQMIKEILLIMGLAEAFNQSFELIDGIIGGI